MCKECVEADDKIRRYGLFASRVSDPALGEELRGLIAQLLALKVALHSRPRQAATIGK